MQSVRIYYAVTLPFNILVNSVIISVIEHHLILVDNHETLAIVQIKLNHSIKKSLTWALNLKYIIQKEIIFF